MCAHSRHRVGRMEARVPARLQILEHSRAVGRTLTYANGVVYAASKPCRLPPRYWEADWLPAHKSERASVARIRPSGADAAGS